MLTEHCVMNDFGVAGHGATANIAVKRFLDGATHGSAQLVAESLRIGRVRGRDE